MVRKLVYVLRAEKDRFVRGIDISIFDSGIVTGSVFKQSTQVALKQRIKETNCE